MVGRVRFERTTIALKDLLLQTKTLYINNLCLCLSFAIITKHHSALVKIGNLPENKTLLKSH